MLSAWLKAEADNINFTETFIWLVKQSILANVSVEKESITGCMCKEGYAVAQGNWKLEMKL